MKKKYILFNYSALLAQQESALAIVNSRVKLTTTHLTGIFTIFINCNTKSIDTDQSVNAVIGDISNYVECFFH